MLKVENLCKNYPSFELKNVSFDVPKGFITGFIGMNGAGKTTTLKAILNLVRPDSGSVTFFGKDMYKYEIELKQEIGFMLGGIDVYVRSTVKKLTDVYKRFYKAWDDAAFLGMLKRFNIAENKKISELSTGMRTKLSIAMALSHGAKLIILDEPTSGLDPIARDDLLDFFMEVIEDGEHSILFSTHITSDLDKCADYILFIREGRLLSSGEKDALIENHRLVKGKKEDLTDELTAKLIGLKTGPFGFTGLILRENLSPSDIIETEKPNLEDIMIYYNRTE